MIASAGCGVTRLTDLEEDTQSLHMILITELVRVYLQRSSTPIKSSQSSTMAELVPTRRRWCVSLYELSRTMYRSEQNSSVRGWSKTDDRTGLAHLNVEVAQSTSH
jgi:hypothetical protein